MKIAILAATLLTPALVHADETTDDTTTESTDVAPAVV
jgi:hypothetical protein